MDPGVQQLRHTTMRNPQCTTTRAQLDAPLPLVGQNGPGEAQPSVDTPKPGARMISWSHTPWASGLRCSL